MKYVNKFLVITMIFAQLTPAADLKCAIKSTTIEKIRCTLKLDRRAYDRKVTFHWHSVNTPQDDREYRTILEGGHGSVYDYRFLRGRAQGLWEVTASIHHDENVEEVIHQFFLDGEILN